MSPACTECYAMMSARRNPKVLGTWGDEGEGGTRIVASPSVWAAPLKWAKAPERPRHYVFTCSIADFFEQWDGPMLDSKGGRGWVGRGPQYGTRFSSLPDSATPEKLWRPLTMDDIRLRAFDVIRQTPGLTYLVLTKRIEHVMGTLRRIAASVPASCDAHDDTLAWIVDWLVGKPPANVWLGTTVESAEYTWRMDELLKVPNAMPWVSAEPLLGPVDWRPWLGDRFECPECGYDHAEAEAGLPPGKKYCGVCAGDTGRDVLLGRKGPGVGWLVVGGESAAREKARRFDLGWARAARDQCREAGAAFFMKQLGTRPGWWEECGLAPGSIPSAVLDHHLAMGGSEPDDTWHDYEFASRKGDDPDEFPEDLRIQEHPR